MTDQRSLSDRRSRALALAGVSLAVLALGLYAGRKVIAREALLAWLRSNGVTAEAQVDGFGFSDFAGQVQIGDPRAPDFVAGDASVTYGLTLHGIEVRSVRLSRPVLRATLHDGKLSLGALDPLIDSFLKRPPQPDRGQPRIDIDQGLVLLGTDAGPMRLDADATVVDGQLISLDAALAPTRLKAAGLDAALGRSTLALRTQAGRVNLTLDAAASSVRGTALSLDAGRLKVTAQGPYPDFKHQRGDGALSLRAEALAKTATVNGQTLRDANLTTAFNGQATGWVETLVVTGGGQADLRAIGGQLGAAGLGVTRASVATTDLRWTRKGGDAVAATTKINALVGDIAAGSLGMRQLSTALSGPVAWSRAGATATLTGGAAGRGSWSGLGAPVSADTPDMAAVKRAARGFTLAAPGLTLALDAKGPKITLLQAARLRPDGGGEAVLTPRGPSVLLGPPGGAFRLTTSGGGLPKVAADLDQLRAVPGGIAARTSLKTLISIGPLLGADIDAAGTLTMAADGTGFAASRCAVVTAKTIELGVNDITHLAGRFCPTDGPLLALAGGGWRLHGRAEAVSADAPSFQVHIANAAGPVEMGLAGNQLHADAPGFSATLSDTTPQPRFNPIRVAGSARLARDVWTATVTGQTPAGQGLGHANLRHVMSTGRGGMDVETGTLRFAEGGLQPAALSPLAAAIASPATGTAAFAGRLDWTTGGLTSSGVLDVPRLDFMSPAGAVKGLSGKIAFTSLVPLVTAPGQTLRAESVAAAAPLTGVQASLAIDAQALTITGGQAAVAGGTVRIESLSLPLTPGATIAGVVDLDGVQLHDIVEASPFGPRMDLDAKVSGRAPFSVKDGHVRVSGGEVHAITPGRLTISREAFTAPDAQGQIASATTPVAVPTAADTGPFTDFAYQAMEDLAFEQLDARIDSLPEGRMGVLFHIKGRHDPPQKKEIRLSVFDLIGRKFMNKPLPLPSGTKVDLTLDTTLNLDDLLADYADYQRLRNSRTVQP